MAEQLHENLSDIKEPSKKEEPSLEIAKGPELEQVVDQINELVEAMQENKEIKAQQVFDLDKAMKKLKVVAGGVELSLKEIRQIPDLQKNIKIWTELLKGQCTNIHAMTYLPENLMPLIYQEHSLSNNWTFCGLKTLSKQAIKSMKEFSAPYIQLNLNGLSDLPIETAEALKDFKAETIFLDGLEKLSTELAQNIKDWKVKYISLLGLTSLPEETAKILSQSQARILSNQELKQQINKFKNKK